MFATETPSPPGISQGPVSVPRCPGPSWARAHTICMGRAHLAHMVRMGPRLNGLMWARDHMEKIIFLMKKKNSIFLIFEK